MFFYFAPKTRGFYYEKGYYIDSNTIYHYFYIFVGCEGQSAESPSGSMEDEVFKIGISQLVEHPALDAARDGFIDGLKEAGFEDGKNVIIEIDNAQADFPTTQTIANKFVGEEVDLILAIATPSAQSAANDTRDIPILITAVTDPVEADLVKSLEKPGTNVTGTTDMNPVKDQLELLKQILPNAKNIGIMYNSAEPNSRVQVDIAKEGKSVLTSRLSHISCNKAEVNRYSDYS